MDSVVDWSRVLMNELPYKFLVEVLFRVSIMFFMLLVFLRLAGKRGVKQLSVFELVIIISLGSAVGDPMLYDNVGLLPGIVVLIVVIGLYRLITVLVAKFKPLEHFIEGKPKLIIQNGEFLVYNLNKEHLAQDEFFSELRLKSVEHLGQVKHSYLETTGEVSTFFKPDEEVEYGLPILPELFNKASKEISKKAHYSCAFCGHTELMHEKSHTCEDCGKEEWVQSINTIRIS